MTMALELHREARRRGLESVFVPTGQTGIAIAGWGISIDAVVSDFIAGATERLVVEGNERGGELLGSRARARSSIPPTRASPSGLIHGSSAALLVLRHEVGRAEVQGRRGHPLPPLAQWVDLHERMALPVPAGNSRLRSR